MGSLKSNRDMRQMQIQRERKNSMNVIPETEKEQLKDPIDASRSRS